MDAGSIGAMGNENLLLAILGIVVLATQLASRIAQIIPGKTADSQLGLAERWSRQLLDFVAGNHGASDDPTAIKK